MPHGPELAQPPDTVASSPTIIELPKDVITAVSGMLSKLYIGYRDRYLMTTVKHGIYLARNKAKEDGGQRQPRKLSDTALPGHLQGKYAIGVFAGENSSKFMCIDVDLKDPEVVKGIIASLVGRGVPREHIHVSTSGNKGYHVDIFFSRPVFTSALKKLYNLVLFDTGCSPAKVEFRPTFTQGVKIPLCKHHKTGNVAWFLDENLEPIQDYSYICSITPWSADEFMKLDLPEIKVHVESSPANTTNAKLNEEMLENIPFPISYSGKGIPPPITEPGTRHRAMLAIAARCHVGTAEACEDLLWEWYKEQDPSLISSDDDDVLADIKEIAVWAYGEGLLKSKARNVITSEDADRILSQPSKLRRKIMFYLTVRINDSKLHKYKISAVNLASVLGVSKNGVGLATRAMREDGSIVGSTGKRKAYTTAAGGIQIEPLAYRLPQEPSPSIYPRMITDPVEIDLPRMTADFDTVYYETMQKFFPLCTLKKYLTASEYEALKSGTIPGANDAA